MLIAVLGSVGLGLVWGWLLGVLTRRKGFRGINLTLIPAMLGQMGEILVLANGRALALFIGATVLALLLYLAWQQELCKRVANTLHS